MATWKRTFYVSFAAQALSITGLSFILPFLPFYLPNLGVTSKADIYVWTGVLGAATPLTMAVFSPLWGLLADRYGRKVMVVRSMFGGGVMLALMAFAQNVYQLLLLRMLQGAVTGTVTASVALVASITPESRSGYALGLMQAAVFIGNSVGPLVGGAVADGLGYRAAFLMAAGIVAAGGLLVRFLAEEEFTPAPAPKNGHVAGFAGVLAAVGFIPALLALFQVRFANSSAATMFPLLVREMLGAERGAATVTGIILASAGVAAAFTAGLLGHFGDRWGHKRLLIASTLLAAVVVFPMGFVRRLDQLGELLVLRVLFGLAAAGIMPCANAIIRRISDVKHLGKAYGITACVTSVGMGTGPLISGYLATQSLAAPFVLTSAVLVLTGIAVAWRVK